MTYTFKLSRRLSRFRTGGLLATLFVFGCTGSDAPVGPDSDPSPSTAPGSVHIVPDSATVGVDGEVQFDAWTGDEAEWRRWSRHRRTSLVKVKVSPDEVRLDPNGSARFSATGKTASGSSVRTNVTWKATGGLIDKDGRYRAGKTAGRYLVIATTSGGLADTARVTVTQASETPDTSDTPESPDTPDSPSPAPAPTKRVELTPATVTLTVGDKQQFALAGKSSDGETFAVSPEYRATGGSISVSGAFTAGTTTGTFRVIATDRGTGLADTSSVTIIARTVGSVSVSPKSAEITVGETEKLSVTVRDSDGETMPSSDVSWTSSNKGVAKVDAAGLVTGVAAGVATITATNGGKSGQATISVVAPSDPAPPPPPPPPPPPSSAGCPTSGYTRLVNVSSSSQLSAAVSSAQPGDQIQLAPGSYGKVSISRSGTASQPITICGPRSAVLNGGSMSSGYTLYLNGASNVRVIGIAVTGAQKGVVLDRSHRNLLDNIEVHHVGYEAVHFRQSSTQNTIRNSYIHHAGQVGNQHYGEGIYVGSSVNNYDNDASNDNAILNNVVEDVASDGIEAKENVRGTIVRGNIVRRTGNADGGSPAAIGTRGGNGLFECNTVEVDDPVRNGFQVYSGGGPGDGDNNVFRYNKVTLKSSGKAVSIHSSQTGNVEHDNTATAMSTYCK